MKQNFLFILITSLLAVACSSTPQKPVAMPTKTNTGTTEVHVKFEDVKNLKTGESVTAYNKECSSKVINTKGLKRTDCSLQKSGQGKIVKFINENTSVVEFDSAVNINNDSVFETETK